MALNAKIISIAAAGLLFIAFIFYCVANGVPAWGTSSTGNVGTIGLWAARTSSSYGSITVTVKCTVQEGDRGVCSRLLAARAFVTLACILSGLSVIVIVISIVMNDKLRSILLLVGKGLAIGCLIMGIIGVAIGINLFTSKDYYGLSWGASSIIGLIAIVINFVGAIATVLIQ